MSIKFLNIIIVASILGISTIGAQHMLTKRDSNASANLENVNIPSPFMPLPNDEINKSNKDETYHIGCDQTIIGNPDFQSLTYNIVSQTPGDKRKESTVSFNLAEKTRTSFAYSVDDGQMNQGEIAFNCNDDYVYTNISEIDFPLLPLNDPIEVGRRWTSTIDVLSFVGSAEVLFEIVRVRNVTSFGKERDEVEVHVFNDEKKIASYTMVSGIGISKFDLTLSIPGVGENSSSLSLKDVN